MDCTSETTEKQTGERSLHEELMRKLPKCRPCGLRHYKSRSIFLPCRKAPRAATVINFVRPDGAMAHSRFCTNVEHVGPSRRSCSLWRSCVHLPTVRHFDGNSSSEALPLLAHQTLKSTMLSEVILVAKRGSTMVTASYFIHVRNYVSSATRSPKVSPPRGH